MVEFPFHVGTTSKPRPAVVIQSDGKVVAGGRTFQTGFEFALARYRTDGTLDRVAVYLDAAVIQEAGEPFPARERRTARV